MSEEMIFPLKKVKFDVNDMLEEVRSAGYFDLSQVDYALMEANGKLSILPKPEYRPLTPKDMYLKVTKEGLCSNVIIDGKIMHNNLKNINKPTPTTEELEEITW